MSDVCSIFLVRKLFCIGLSKVLVSKENTESQNSKFDWRNRDLRGLKRGAMNAMRITVLSISARLKAPK